MKAVFVPIGKQRLVATWHLASESNGPRPVIVMAPGFAATCKMRLLSYAARFVAAGFHVLAFDYRHFGASDGQPRGLVCVKRQLEDWVAAIQWVRQQPEVDTDQIALWGSSFSGGHVLVTAARDGRIAAVVSQVPFVDGWTTGHNLRALQCVRLAVKVTWDLVRSAAGRMPVYIPVAGRPGETAACTSKDALAGYTRLSEGDPDWIDEVAARGLLEVALYRPARHVKKLNCPTLFCIAARDALTPIGPVLRAARIAPHNHVVNYDIGHFDIYFGRHFEEAVCDQIEFLQAHLSKPHCARGRAIPHDLEAETP